MRDKTMLAAVFEGEGRLSVKEVPVPAIREPDEVLLRVDAASICGTDVHILEVPPGHPATPGAILGHEYTGTVLEMGSDVQGLETGDRVVVDPNLTCGKCRYCRSGMPNMCQSMTTLGIFINGGFARYNVAPANALHKISEDVPPDVAALAEPLSCVVNGTQKVRVQPGESVAVLGAGPIGLMMLQLALACGAGKIIVSELLPEKRELARKLGAHLAVDPVAEDLKAVLAREFENTDCVIEAAGSPVTQRQAIDLAGKGCTVMLFGLVPPETEIPLKTFEVFNRELTITSSFINPYTFTRAIRMLAQKRLVMDDIISDVIELKDIVDVFVNPAYRKRSKVLIKLGGER